MFAGCSSKKHTITNVETVASSKKKQQPLALEHPKAFKVVQVAKSKVGIKYKYGGLTKKGLDCSGLVYTTYKEIGLDLPRTSGSQASFGRRVYIGELHRGDLIFFSSSKGGRKVSHVGIVSYFKDGKIKMVHSSSSRGVVEDEVNEYYWSPRYIRACRPLSEL
jgi:cell wall-associated NlpC family hydrolase